MVLSIELVELVDEDAVEKEEEEDDEEEEEDEICAAVVVACASTIKFHPFIATAATVIAVEKAVVTLL